jgi:hypothetical protein
VDRFLNLKNITWVYSSDKVACIPPMVEYMRPAAMERINKIGKNVPCKITVQIK